MIGVELSVVFFLILLNGVFAMSEMAIVSSRRTRLQSLAEQGDRGAQAALALKDDPSRFLAAVQIGITLIGILAGAFSGATIATKFGAELDAYEIIAPHGQSVAFGAVVVGITFFSLVLGELVPKRIALAHAETIAARMAIPLSAVALGVRPFVALLGYSTSFVLTALRIKTGAAQPVTEEEMHSVLAEGAEAGVIDEAERQMVTRLLKLADRSIVTIMTPRRDVTWVDVSDPPEAVLSEIRISPYSRVVVARDGDLDEPLGIVQKKDLLDRVLAGEKIDIAATVREPMFLPDGTSIFVALEAMKRSPLHIAFVVDEFGGFEGLVTLTDIVEAIAGDLYDDDVSTTPSVSRRADGSYLVDGSAALDELEISFGVKLDSGGRYHTVAGMLLDHMKRIPKEGEIAEIQGWRIEILDTDMGGRRIDKVLFTKMDA
jgi:putative hemolysin